MSNTSPISQPAPFATPVAAIPLSTTIIAEHEMPATITITASNGNPDVSIPRSAYTLEGFRTWATSAGFPERGQVTFSPEGMIVDMSPELLESHNYVKTDIGHVLIGIARQKMLGRYLSDRALYSSDVGGFSTEPDSLLISGKSIASKRCNLIESKRPGLSIEIQGAVDWVLEVVSPSSVHKDKKILLEGYYRAGVAEYWIVDAIGKEIDFQIFVPAAKEFTPVESHAGWLTSPTFGCAFRLTVDRDKDGFVQYTLHVQEES